MSNINFGFIVLRFGLKFIVDEFSGSIGNIGK